jgi:hypothetical protein
MSVGKKCTDTNKKITEYLADKKIMPIFAPSFINILNLRMAPTMWDI